MVKERIAWLDTGKFICIYFVMMTHIESCTWPLRTFFEPFFLTGFLFFSGYTFRVSTSFGEFAKKKSYQLLIPWLIWGVLSIIFHQIFSSFTHNYMRASEEIVYFFIQIRGLKDSVWFLNMMFMAYIVFYWVVRKYEEKKNNKILLILFLIYFLGQIYTYYMPGSFFPWGVNKLPWHLEYMPVSTLFMFLGYLFKKEIEERLPLNHDKFSFIGISLYLFFIIICILLKSLNRYPQGIDILIDTFLQFSGLFFLISLSKYIRTNRLISYVGQNTLLYFPMHIYVYVLMQWVFRKAIGNVYLNILNSILASSVFAFIFVWLLVIILVLPAIFINHYFPFMAGKY